MGIGRAGIRVALGALSVVALLPSLLAHRAAAFVGDVTEFHIVTKFGISDVTTMVAGPDGNLWFPVPDGIGDHFGRLTPQGVYTEFKIEGPSPRQVIVGPDGALWFTQWGGAEAALGRITTAGVYSRVPIADAALLNGLTVGPDGALWFTEFTRSRVGRYDLKAGTFRFFDLDKSTQPVAITSFAGSLWVGDVYTNVLYRISTTGTIESKLTPGFSVSDFAIHDNVMWMGGGGFGLIATLNPDERTVTATRLKTSADRIAFDTFGNLWFADASGAASASIHRLTQGTVSDYPIPARYGSAGAITLGPDDQIWIVESRFAQSPSFPGTQDNIIGRVLTGAPLRSPTTASTTSVAAPVVARVDGIADVPDPGQLDLSPRAIATSFGFAGLLLLLALLASDLINATLDANWNIVRRWPGIRLADRVTDRDGSSAPGGSAGFWATWAGYGVFLATATLLVVSWHPSVERTGEALVGVVVGGVARAVCALWFAHHRWGTTHRGFVHARPASLVIGAAAMAASWAAGLSSPVIFGILAGVAFQPELPRERAGALTAFTSAAFGIIAVAGWFARWGLRASVDHPGRVLQLIENGLSILFLAAVWALALGMVPLKFFAGHTVRAWRPWVWFTLWFAGLAFAIHVVLSDYGVSAARGNDQWRLLAAEAVVVVAAFILWLAFARRSPGVPSTADQASVSGPR